MSEGAAIGWMSVWLVCVVVSTVLLIRFLNHAKRVDPKGYERMVSRTKRGSKWATRTFLVNPSKDFWENHK